MANLYLVEDASRDETRAADDIRWALRVDQDSPVKETIAKMEVLIAHVNERLAEANPSQRHEFVALRHRFDVLLAT